ncbi:MAG: hypothetical protein HY253_07350 [Burkholderiales bacterium]|nr:hypothetical protein [Burkholderiales bacterium]
MNKKWLFYALLTGVAAALGFFFSKYEIKVTATAPKTTVATSVTSVAAPSVSPTPETEAPPPWVNNGNQVADVNSGANTLPRMDAKQGMGAGEVPMSATSNSKQKLAELGKMQTELTAFVQSGNTDPKKLLDILHKLKQTQGSSVGGVNIDALINNLEKTQQLQELSLEMQKESQKAGGPDPKKMQENIERLKKLQAQMRTDVTVTNARAATPAK